MTTTRSSTSASPPQQRRFTGPWPVFGFPGSDKDEVFLDGGLWANAPVLIGLIDALEMATTEDRIEVYSLGTSAPPEG